jgi:hypothetical protein
MFTYLLLLPSFVLALNPISFKHFLNNTETQVNINDHTNMLLIHRFDNVNCDGDIVNTQGLEIDNCFCNEEEQDACFMITNCGENSFHIDLYHYTQDEQDKCHSDLFRQSFTYYTNMCDEGNTYECSNPDTHDDNSNTDSVYDYINMESYNNNDCSGRIVFSQKFEMNECKCNNEEGWCVYPLYCNDDQLAVELYFGNECNRNHFSEIYTMQPNMCTQDGDFFTCHHDDEKIDHIAKILSIIGSILFCIGFVCLIRCCCVQNPCGRSQQVPQPPQPPPQVIVVAGELPMAGQHNIQMVRQAPIQPVQMVQQAPIQPVQMVQQPPQNPEVVPAYTYPYLKNGEENRC